MAESILGTLSESIEEKKRKLAEKMEKQMLKRLHSSAYPMKELMAFYRCAQMEMETKLFKPEEGYDIKFDVSELLRTDKKSQAEYFTKLFNLGVLSPNDIRKELDMEEIEGGDIHVAQINLTSIKNLEFVNATADNRLKEPEMNTENNQENNDQENSDN